MNKVTMLCVKAGRRVKGKGKNKSVDSDFNVEFNFPLTGSKHNKKFFRENPRGKFVLQGLSKEAAEDYQVGKLYEFSITSSKGEK